jgi:hypothetical protein
VSKEYEVFYEERVDKETYRFYLDEEIGEVEIHCVYKSGERDSISIPMIVLKHFMNRLEVK